MTTLSKLSFQEKGHGLFKKKERHAQESMVRKKVGHMKVQVFKRKKERVGHLKVQVFRKRESEREREIAHVQRKRNKGERWFMKGVHTPSTQLSANKTPRHSMTISLQSYRHNLWAIQKEIKDAYPKKVCHMPTRHVKKKERKDAHPKKVCHTPTRCVKKKEKKII